MIPLKTIIKWVSRIYMATAIVWMIVYWISKYTKIEVVEETKISIGLVPLLIIIVVSAIVVYGGFFILLVSWWEKIKEDKFSIYTFLPIYILLIGTMGLAWGLTDKLKILIQINADRFIQDLIGYQGTMINSLLILGSGLLVGTLAHYYVNKA